MMQKRVGILVLFVMISLGVSSQTAFVKGQVNLAAGYGIGNVWKSYLRNTWDLETYGITYRAVATGPFCLLADYNIGKHISIGAAVGYSKTFGTATYTNNGIQLKFDESLQSFSALARANFHWLTTKRLDPYIGGGIGYYHFLYRNESNTTPTDKVPGNFGYSLQLGARYYVTPHLGMYAELGYIAGSFAQGGIAVKF